MIEAIKQALSPLVNEEMDEPMRDAWLADLAVAALAAAAPGLREEGARMALEAAAKVAEPPLWNRKGKPGLWRIRRKQIADDIRALSPAQVVKGEEPERQAGLIVAIDMALNRYTAEHSIEASELSAMQFIANRGDMMAQAVIAAIVAAEGIA